MPVTQPTVRAVTLEGWTLAYPKHPITGRREPNVPQALAHACPADVTLFGGQRGPGKTEWLCVDGAKACLQHPHMLAFIFRRTRDEMKSTVIPRLRRILPTEIAKWSRQDHSFLFCNGSVLTLDFMKTEEEIGKYLGAEAGWIGVDQAEQLTEFTVAAMISLLRDGGQDGTPWPKQMRLTANPGIGPGVAFLRRWFIKPTVAELGNRPRPTPGQVWRPLPGPMNPTALDKVPTRCFIPGSFNDNTALKAKDPDYIARVYIAFTPEVARAQAEGDWDASDATMVGSRWAEAYVVKDTDTVLQKWGLTVGQTIDWHVIRKSTWRPPKGALLFGSVDYGFGVPYAFYLHASLPGGHTRTFAEIYLVGKVDREQAELIRDLLVNGRFEGDDPLRPAKGYDLEWLVYDPSMAGSRLEQGLAKSIIEVYGDVLTGIVLADGRKVNVQLVAGAGGRSARQSRPNRWLDALGVAPDGFPYWSVTTACPHLIRTVPEVPRDPDDPDVELDASENHAYESVGRFFEARPHSPRVAPVSDLTHLDDLSRRHQEALARTIEAPKFGRATIVMPGAPALKR